MIPLLFRLWPLRRSSWRPGPPLSRTPAEFALLGFILVRWLGASDSFCLAVLASLLLLSGLLARA